MARMRWEIADVEVLEDTWETHFRQPTATTQSLCKIIETIGDGEVYLLPSAANF